MTENVRCGCNSRASECASWKQCPPFSEVELSESDRGRRSFLSLAVPSAASGQKSMVIAAVICI